MLGRNGSSVSAMRLGPVDLLSQMLFNRYWYLCKNTFSCVGCEFHILIHCSESNFKPVYADSKADPDRGSWGGIF